MLDVLPLLVVIALVGVTSVTLRRRAGIAHPDHHAFSRTEMRDVGLDPRGPTFVVFTAPGCRTCGPTRALVEEAAAGAGAAVVVIDAVRHEDLAAAHRVLRAPTTFLVHADGRIAGRIAGLPRPGELEGLLGRSWADVNTAA